MKTTHSLPACQAANGTVILLGQKISQNGKFTHLFTKLFLLGLIAAWVSSSPLKAQPVIMPATGQAPTQTACTGTVLDPGGVGNYPNTANSFIVFSAFEGGSVQITFEAFNTESGYDFVRLYDGPDTGSPLIASYAGTQLPNGGNPIASSGQHLTLRFSSDATETFAGFIAHWQLIDGPTPPSALFVPSDNNVPFGFPITFFNSSSAANDYLWNFGDGNTSTEINPTHIYTSSGNFTVSLTAINCSGAQNIYSATVTVQNAGQLTYLPASFNITLNQGDSIILPLTLTNAAGGTLAYSIEGASLQTQKRLKVLALINDADVLQEYPATLAAINAFYTDYTLTELSTYNPMVLQNALNNADVLLIPEQESCTTATASAFSTFAPMLQTFVQNGGTVVVNGTNQTACMFNLGLFSGTYQNFYLGDLYHSLTNDPLMDGVANPYPALNTTYYYDITNPDVVRVVEYNNYDVVCYRNIGAGKAILIGHDFRFSNPNMQRIQANAFKNTPQAQAANNWLYVSGNTGELSAGQSATIQVEFNTVGVYGNSYTQNLTIYTNDPNNPVVIIPCNITITGGIPTAELSPTTLSFGSVMQGTTTQQSFAVTNSGNGVLQVAGISSSNPAFSANLTGFSLNGGGATQHIQVTFAPLAVQPYNATLTIATNIGNFEVLLNGTGIGAPIINVLPNPVAVTVNVGETATVPFTISNSGQGSLSYNVQMPTSGNRLNILMFTLGVQDDAANIAAIIDEYAQGEYELFETNTALPDELAAALQGKDLFIVPRITNLAGQQAFLNFKQVLHDFTHRGGMVLFTGTLYQRPLIYSDLMPVGAPASNLGANAEVVNASHPITQNIPASVYIPGFPVVFNEQDDLIQLIVQPANGINTTLAAYRPVGNGYVVYLGFSYLSDEVNNIKALYNTVNWAISMKPATQISYTPTWGNIAAGSNQTVNLTVNAGNLTGGMHERQIVITSNSPGNPSISLPIMIQVNGAPQISVSPADDLNFGSVIIGNTHTIPITVSNTGTDTLYLSGINATLPQFSADITNAAIAPQRSRKINIGFTPTAIQNYNGVINLPSNAGAFSINISGAGLGAPATGINPTAIDVTLQNAATQTQNVNITNSGADNLQFMVNGALGTTHIALLGYAAYDEEYTGLRKSITNNAVNFTLTEINTIYPATLQQALQGKHILFVAYQNNSVQQSSILTELTAVIANFAQNGGTVVYAGIGCAPCLTIASSLLGEATAVSAQPPLSPNYDYYYFDDPTHPLAAGLTTPAYISDFHEGLNFAAPDVVKIASNPNSGNPATMLAYRKIGAGMVIYTSATFYDNYNPTLGILARNIINFATGAFPTWLSTTFTGIGTVPPANNATVPLTFNSTGLAAGLYRFDMRVNTNQPDLPFALVPLTLSVETTPQTAFAAEPQLTCNGTVTFTDLSAGPPTSWLWDFGDGNTATQQNPSHTYAQEGVYSVTLQTCNVLGCNTAFYPNFVNYNSDFCNEPVLIPADGSTLLLTNCNGILQDSGGNNNYGNNHNGIVTIAPPGANFVVLNFNFIMFQNCCDGLRIYDGPDTNAPLIGNFKGPDLPNGNGIITSSGGAITLQQYTNTSVNASGFELVWNCANPVAPPITVFTNTVADACLGVMQFTDASANFPNSWLWDFGDGGSSTQQNPMHQYAQNGSYTVTLTACNSIGCNTFTSVVAVAFSTGICTYLMPADATLLNLPLCQGILMDSGGNFNYGNDNNGIVTITPPGALSVTVQFTQFSFENSFDGIRIFDGPSSNSPLIGVFSGTNLPFGGAPFTTSSGAITIEQFTDNSVNSTGFVLTWSCEAITGVPATNFSYAVTAPCNGQVTFTDLSGNYANTWLWDFGDGSAPVSAQNPQHSYTQNGVYTVTLQSCNTVGCNTYSTQVTLNNVLEMNVTIPQYIQVNTPVMFVDNTVGAVFWQWNFGYGPAVTGEISNPVIFYPQTGVYTVVLIVTDANGCTKTYTQNVEVVVNIGVTNTVPTTPLLKIAPNPTQDLVTVFYPSANAEPVTLTVTDLASKVIYTHTQTDIGNYRHQFSLLYHPQGMYLVHLQTGNQLLTQKVLKQ